MIKNIEILKLTGVFSAVLLLSVGCGGEKKPTEKEKVSKPVVTAPSFNEDSAYSFVRKQVDFGPRVPNSVAHQQTGDFLIEKLQEYGATVEVQSFDETTHDGVVLSLRNIMGKVNPEAKKRILLAAHWDTRPYADKDSTDANKAIDGANDGASGVGVLLEIARIMNKTKPNVGVDIMLFDGEDWGEKNGESQKSLPSHLVSWWALGSQYWSKNKGKYAAYYGILLDMVGARGSQFHIEGYSDKYAPKIVKKVWNTASQIGYGNYFVHHRRGGIVDDHLYVNTIGKIPMINIVHFDPTLGYFGDYHHTHKDNMDIIDKRTLKAVGQTVLQVVYNE